MTFTGPLVVSNGTWTSSLGYAASAFKANGGTLVLSGALTNANVVFEATDSGTLTLAGATTPNDASPDLALASGGTTDYFTRDNAAATHTLGILTLGEGAKLSLTGESMGADAVSAGSIVLSATAANPVELNFTGAESIPGGTYNILTITGGGTFAADDVAKFALDANVPEGSSLSVSGNLLVLTVPATNPATWTGGAGDGKFSSVGNWLGNAVPGAEDDVVISVDTETTLDCDVALNVNSITFLASSAKVTIDGTGSITNASTIVNGSGARHVINVPVEFLASDAYAPIDVTGEVDFQGGVTGTVPVNHSTFYGNYTLTAEKWTLSSAITLAANATVTATGTTIETSKAALLNAEAGSTFSIKRLTIGAGGNIFGTFAGNLTVPYIYDYSQGAISFNSGFSGVLRVNGIHHHSGSSARDYTFSPASSATIVFGSGSCGIEMQRGVFKVNGQTFHSSGDWEFDITDSNYKSDTMAIEIGESGIVVDTSDYDNPNAPGHTVSVNNSATYGTRALSGSGSVAACGNGTFKFNKTGKFTGGLVASDSVTIAVNKDANPGKGNVTFKDTATFDLVQSGSGTVPVTGTLTMAGGTTLKIPTLSAGVLPLSVNALAFEGEGAVGLEIGELPVEAGYYSVLSSQTGLPDHVAAKFDLAAPSAASFYVDGGTLFVRIGDTSNLPSGVWVGGVDSSLSNRLNWKNLALPQPGDVLDFSGVALATTLSADFADDIVFRTLVPGSGVLSIDGNLHVQTYTNTLVQSSGFSIASGSVLTVDGDVVIIDATAQKGKVWAFEALNGTVDVKGHVISEGVTEAFICNTGNGTVRTKGIINNSLSGDAIKFNANTKGHKISWFIGEDGCTGLRADNNFWVDTDRSGATIRPLSDFAIAGPQFGVRSPLDFDTDDDSGIGRTITVDAVVYRKGGSMTVGGSGKVVINYNTTALGEAFDGTVAVKDTATLAVKPGMMATAGAIEVDSGAAFEVAGSGAVTPGGGLALADNAVLAFYWTKSAPPCLDLADCDVAFAEGAVTNVAVRISSALPRARGGRTRLTTGGRFKGVGVSCVGEVPKWVLGVEVDENGDIVIDTKKAFSVIFR